MIQTDKRVALYKHKINKLFTNKLAWITAVKFLSPMKQLVAQVTVGLVVEQGVLIVAAVFLLCQLALSIYPSECYASFHELCPLHCCKGSSFSVSLCPSHSKTACDRLCPSHCRSQQLPPAAVPMQPMCNPVCQSHCLLTCPKFCCKFKSILSSTCPHHCQQICQSSCPAHCCASQHISIMEHSQSIQESCPAICSSKCLPSCPSFCCKVSLQMQSSFPSSCSVSCISPCQQHCCQERYPPNFSTQSPAICPSQSAIHMCPAQNQCQ